MAVAELIVSRRALLGAAWPLALAAPLRRQGPSPSCSPSSRRRPGPSSNDGQPFAVTKWDRALTRYRQAESALAAVDGADEALFDRLVGRLNRALDRLFRTPAPNLPALATKLDLLVAHQVWELRYAEASMAALKRDAHRLARQAG